jgi:heat shock protein HslJ
MVLHNTAWQLERLGSPDADTPAVASVAVTLQFSAEQDDGGRVSGSGGCNRYFGSYRIAGDELHVGQLGSTKMFCMDDAVRAQEDRYFHILEGAEHFTLADDGLVIRGANGTLRFRSVAPDGQ